MATVKADFDDERHEVPCMPDGTPVGFVPWTTHARMWVGTKEQMLTSATLDDTPGLTCEVTIEDDVATLTVKAVSDYLFALGPKRALTLTLNNGTKTTSIKCFLVRIDADSSGSTTTHNIVTDPVVIKATAAGKPINCFTDSEGAYLKVSRVVLVDGIETEIKPFTISGDEVRCHAWLDLGEHSVPAVIQDGKVYTQHDSYPDPKIAYPLLLQLREYFPDSNDSGSSHVVRDSEHIIVVQDDKASGGGKSYVFYFSGGGSGSASPEGWHPVFGYDGSHDTEAALVEISEGEAPKVVGETFSLVDDDGNYYEDVSVTVTTQSELPDPSSETWMSVIEALIKMNGEGPFYLNGKGPFYFWVRKKSWDHPIVSPIYKADGNEDGNEDDEDNDNRKKKCKVSAFKLDDGGLTVGWKLVGTVGGVEHAGEYNERYILRENSARPGVEFVDNVTIYPYSSSTKASVSFNGVSQEWTGANTGLSQRSWRGQRRSVCGGVIGGRVDKMHTVVRDQMEYVLVSPKGDDWLDRYTFEPDSYGENYLDDFFGEYDSSADQSFSDIRETLWLDYSYTRQLGDLKGSEFKIFWIPHSATLENYRSLSGWDASAIKTAVDDINRYSLYAACDLPGIPKHTLLTTEHISQIQHALLNALPYVENYLGRPVLRVASDFTVFPFSTWKFPDEIKHVIDSFEVIEGLATTTEPYESYNRFENFIPWVVGKLGFLEPRISVPEDLLLLDDSSRFISATCAFFDANKIVDAVGRTYKRAFNTKSEHSRDLAGLTYKGHFSLPDFDSDAISDSNDYAKISGTINDYLYQYLPSLLDRSLYIRRIIANTKPYSVVNSNDDTVTYQGKLYGVDDFYNCLEQLSMVMHTTRIIDNCTAASGDNDFLKTFKYLDSLGAFASYPKPCAIGSSRDEDGTLYNPPIGTECASPDKLSYDFSVSSSFWVRTPETGVFARILEGKISQGLRTTYDLGNDESNDAEKTRYFYYGPRKYEYPYDATVYRRHNRKEYAELSLRSVILIGVPTLHMKSYSFTATFTCPLPEKEDPIGDDFFSKDYHYIPKNEKARDKWPGWGFIPISNSDITTIDAAWHWEYQRIYKKYCFSLDTDTNDLIQTPWVYEVKKLGGDPFAGAVEVVPAVYDNGRYHVYSFVREITYNNTTFSVTLDREAHLLTQQEAEDLYYFDCKGEEYCHCAPWIENYFNQRN